MSYKIKWKVQDKETGRFASFYKRGWPTASYNDNDGPFCAFIKCKDEYIPAKVKTGDHSELTLYIRDHSTGNTVAAKKKFKTIKEVKKALPKILKEHPHLLPGDL